MRQISDTYLEHLTSFPDVGIHGDPVPGAGPVPPRPRVPLRRGAGPLYDIGPYHLTALVHVFGPFAQVAAVGSKGHGTRTVQVGDRAGTVFPCTAHPRGRDRPVSGGGITQSVFTFDSPLVRCGIVEITGTEGTLLVPDPNNFDGDVRITRPRRSRIWPRSRSGSPSPPPASSRAAAPARWTWLGASEVVGGRSPQASSATTSSTR